MENVEEHDFVLMVLHCFHLSCSLHYFHDQLSGKHLFSCWWFANLMHFFNYYWVSCAGLEYL